MNGFLVVDKPQGLTSHDVVLKVRRGTDIKRIGHAGTLDPMATGVLVLCLGYATRLSEYVMNSTKVYRATLRLGIETDTYDAEGRITAEADASHITREQFEAALDPFRGSILQVPPMYSAIQQGGKRLYELARAGQEVERAPRPVTIYALTVTDWQPPDVSIEAACTAGTYIRSLAHDIGATLGVGAHLIALRRTQSGSLADPVAWETLLSALADGTWPRFVLDESVPLAAMPAVYLDAKQTADVLHGKAITPPEQIEGTARLYDPERRLIAVAEMQTDRLQPVKVFG